VALGVSLTGMLSQNEMTGDREGLVGRIDNSSLSKTSSRQARNPPHFTSLGMTITPDQAIQSDPLVNLSITPSDKVWVPPTYPKFAASANCVHLASTFVVLNSSNLILILAAPVLGRLTFEEEPGLIGWNEAWSSFGFVTGGTDE